MHSVPQTPAFNGSPHFSPLSLRFCLRQCALLLLSAILLIWLSRHESWDIAIARMWFDPLTQRFPWHDNIWLDRINHHLIKDLIIVGAVTLLLAGVIRRQPRWLLVALLMGAGPLVVGLLKASSAHSCPWDLVEFGGRAVSFPLFSARPADSGPGHCFPGGHASSGFSAMALFFLFYPRYPRLARYVWWAALTLGMLMGFGQMMRGAHFLSHNLWAAWWVWLTQCTTFAVVAWLVNSKKQPVPETVVAQNR